MYHIIFIYSSVAYLLLVHKGCVWDTTNFSYQNSFDLFYVFSEGSHHNNPTTFSLYCVLFAIHHNLRPPSVPGQLCVQNHAMVGKPLQKSNSTNHRKQSLFSTMISSRSRYFLQTLIHSTVTRDKVRNNHYILMFARDIVILLDTCYNDLKQSRLKNNVYYGLQ